MPGSTTAPFGKDRNQQLAGDVWFYYGGRYGEYLGTTRQGDAEDYLPAMVELAPGRADAYATLGEYYADAGKLDSIAKLAGHRIGVVTGNPALYLLSLFLFLYVACEVGVWNWLAKHLVAQGVPESQALNILSLGFALGLLIGRVVVSRILIKVAASTVTLYASMLMAVTTYLALQTTNPTVAWVAVFCAGLAMAPVFPTTLAMTGDAFPRATATAMGIVITFGWIGFLIDPADGEPEKRLASHSKAQCRQQQ